MDSDKTVKIIFFLLFNFFLLLLFFTFPRVRCNPARHWGRTEQSKHKLFAAAANTHTHTHAQQGNPLRSPSPLSRPRGDLLPSLPS